MQMHPLLLYMELFRKPEILWGFFHFTTYYGNFYRIAVFRDGRIVELGTHDNLMAENGLYQEMYSKQASYYQ
ncbi:MAG TPA: hypothetical protein DF984_06760 [Anaerolineaceae bacterium]|nr:hypothetical protein [Anaerolineaceae bacterium]